MALKQKTNRFKEISGKMDVGGAPIFNDDLIMMQENDIADFINSAEYYRSKLPELIYGTPSGKQFENGLILSGLTYVKNSPTQATINEGYFLSGGEVCYYPGGTFSVGVFPFLVHLKKGNANYTSRVFNDGFNKQILVNYDVVVETSEIHPVNGLEMPIGTTIVPTDEVVVLEIGNVSNRRVAETYFTKQAALGVIGIGNRLSTNAFVPASTTPTYAAYTSFATNRPGALVSRVDNEGFTHIHGSVVFSGYAGIEVDVKLNSHSFAHSSGDKIGIPCMVNVNGNSLFFPAMCSVFGNGTIRFRADFNGLATDDYVLPATYYLDCKIMGNVPAQYTYDKAFLDVTP